MSILGDIFSLSNDYANRAAARENQDSQNDWQANQNDKDRMWQQQMWQQQFAAENEQWWKRFNAQNEYNSPEELMKRLTAAGINPAVALGQLSGSGGLAAAGGSSSPTSPAPMGAHQVTPGAGYVPFGSQTAQMFSSIAQLLEARASNKKVGLESEYQRATLDAVVQKTLSEAGHNDALTAYTKFQQTIDEAYRGKKLDAETKKLLAEVDSEVARAFALFQQGDKDAAQKLFFEAQTRITDSKDKALNEFIPHITTYVKAMTNNLYAQTKELNTRSDLNVANKDYTEALTKTIDGLRQGQIDGQDLANTAAKIANELSARENYRDLVTSDGQIMMFAQQLEQQGYVTKSAYEKLRQDTFNSNWQGVKFFFDCAESATRSFSNIKNPINFQQRNEIQERFQQSYENRTTEMYNNRTYWQQQNKKGQK